MRHLLMTVITVALAAGGALSAAAAPHTDIPTFAVTGAIGGPDGFWDLLAIDDSTHTLYLGHSDRVISVDLDNGRLNPEFAKGRRVHAAIPLPGNRVLSTNGASNTVTVFDAGTGKLLATIPTGASPDDALLDPASGLVLVMDHEGGDITLIDPRTLKSPGKIEVGGDLELAAATGHDKVFVNIENKAKVAVIDTKVRKVAAYYDLPGCDGPTGLAYDSRADLVLSACANEKAVALHGSDGSLAATVKIGKGPDGAMYDAKRNLFFVPCGRDGVLDVIAEKGGMLELVSTVTTAVGARTGALDAKTGKIYLPTADFDFKHVQPGKRPALVPGSFRILVVSATS